MIRAYSAIASRLERGRQTAGLGLTLMQARLLRAAATSPDRTLGELMPEAVARFQRQPESSGGGGVAGPRCRRWSWTRSAHGGGRGTPSRHRGAMPTRRSCSRAPPIRTRDGQARSKRDGIETTRRPEAGGGPMIAQGKRPGSRAGTQLHANGSYLRTGNRIVISCIQTNSAA